MKKLVTLLIAAATMLSAHAQSVTVHGTVVSAKDGEPLIGVSVIPAGSSTGVSTDLDGNYTINVDAKGSLQFNYIGFVAQTLPVNGRTEINVTLQEDSKMLDEVVVVGYGVQKKSVVTAAISKIDDEALSQTAPTRMDNALKGLASGVTVTSSSGQPGAASRVRVRGIGTINNSDPLYIVDGMPIEGGLDYLNPNDIASIEVLKDAASGAVYGARAANGVILVTTKMGKEGRCTVNYDFSYGWQSAWKKRNVLNATQYAIMLNEGHLNAGMAPVYNNPYEYGEGTDWQSEVFNNNAPMMNHQVSISGASQKVNYLVSMGYFTQDGIVGGNFGRSNYQRLTLRSNTRYTVFDSSKDRNWLNNLTITVNASYARIKSTGVDTNSCWGSPLGSALALSPMLTVYDPNPEAQLEKYKDNSYYYPIYGSNGQLFTVPGTDYGEMNNPVALLSLPGAQGWSHKFVANFSGELQIWDGLKYRISYGADLSFWGSDSHVVNYYLSGNNHSSGRTSVSSSSERGTVWQLENILSYDKTIGGHSFTILLGQSAKQSRGYYLGGTRYGMIDPTGAKPWIDYCNGLQENGDMAVYGGKQPYSTLSSLFARISYNYDERYMLQATVRRDGSSRFGSNNHYATFPSFSVGWNITNENFVKNVKPWWFNTAKVRFSWGKNGNENIGNFRYTVLTSTGNNYIFGVSESVLIGTKASTIPNPNLKWEESTQTDVGLDLAFLNNSLTFSVDYYKKRTNGMLMEMNIPSYVGESKPIGNVGKMENSGVEFDLHYSLNVGDFNLNFGGNLSYLKNKLIEYGNDSGWANLDSFQGTGTITRAENGKPFPFFYGYKTDGVYQNIAEAAEGPTYWDGTSPVPGDVRYVDITGDGIINDEDKTDIGKGMPDWTFGFNIGASWKGLDFNMFWQGTAGNQVFDATRRTDLKWVNLPSWMLNRWTGEGTSNRLPRFVFGDNHNWQSSDLYVYDGSYLRLKNIQLGYTLPQKLTKKVFVQKFRVYVAAENLVTLTKYHGYDPEISSGATSLGVDYGVYPQARVFTVGLNLQF